MNRYRIPPRPRYVLAFVCNTYTHTHTVTQCACVSVFRTVARIVFGFSSKQRWIPVSIMDYGDYNRVQRALLCTEYWKKVEIFMARNTWRRCVIVSFYGQASALTIVFTSCKGGDTFFLENSNACETFFAESTMILKIEISSLRYFFLLNFERQKFKKFLTLLKVREMKKIFTYEGTPFNTSNDCLSFIA